MGRFEEHLGYRHRLGPVIKDPPDPLAIARRRSPAGTRTLI
jgi:hypothetical protein